MLKIENLSGGYLSVPVLHEVSFSVGDGELVGLIGLNGAGKSTTINEIIGLLEPYTGSITIDGKSLLDDPKIYRQKIGYIPESPQLYEELTLQEHLDTMIMAYKLERDTTLAQAQQLLQLFRLEDKLDWLPTQFSKGMKQKVMIIQALLVQPRLLIVDEPFLGLDPLAIADLIDLLATEKQRGTAILMSTHVLDSAEKMCDRFVILHHGRVRAQGTLAELQKEFNQPEADLATIYRLLTQRDREDAK